MTALDRCQISHNLIARVLLSELHRALATIDAQQRTIDMQRAELRAFIRPPDDDSTDAR